MSPPIGLGLGLGISTVLGSVSAGEDAAQFANGPAPSGFHWEFVTVDDERVTENGVYVVTLVAD